MRRVEIWRTAALRPWAVALAAIAGSAVLAALAVSAITEPAPVQTAESPPDLTPKRHFRIERPADLADADALSIYQQVKEEMAAGYALSRLPAATDYRTWQRYNKAPYRSATHGQRYVNNYANPIARDYGRFEAAGKLPQGAVLAKDSFAVTSRGDVFAGPLFLMEKMSPGFAPNGSDWRYTMVMPDGSLFGTTGGLGAERVGFCATCHKAAGDRNDHLFFVPAGKRLRVLRLDPEAK